ncbi:MAG: hypothetical protein WDW36_004089 [Sanguina aurantia]
MKEDPFEAATHRDSPSGTVAHRASDAATVATAVAARVATKPHVGTSRTGQDLEEQKVRDHVWRIKREAGEEADASVKIKAHAEAVGGSGGWSEASLLSRAKAKLEENQLLIASIAASLGLQEETPEAVPLPTKASSSATTTTAAAVLATAAAFFKPSGGQTKGVSPLADKATDTKPYTKSSTQPLAADPSNTNKQGQKVDAGSDARRENATSSAAAVPANATAVPASSKSKIQRPVVKESTPETMSLEQRLRSQQRELRRQQHIASLREFAITSSSSTAATPRAEGGDEEEEGGFEEEEGGGHVSRRRMQGSELARNAPWTFPALLTWRLFSLSLLATTAAVLLALIELFLSGLPCTASNGTVGNVPRLAARGARRIARSLVAARRAATLHVKESPRGSSRVLVSTYGERGSGGSAAGGSGGARMLAVAADATGAFAGTFLNSLKAPDGSRSSSEFVHRRWTGDGDGMECDPRDGSFTSISCSPGPAPMRFSTALTQPVHRTTSGASSTSCASHCAYNIGDLGGGPILRTVTEARPPTSPYYYESQA